MKWNMVPCSICGHLHCNNEPRCISCAKENKRPTDKIPQKKVALHRHKGWKLAEQYEIEKEKANMIIYIG
jgi:hypothetical protein